MGFDVTQQGEFVAHITRHQTMLRAYIISLMPGMDGVDDVLQETNIVLWEKRATFQPGTNFRAWACAIARFEVKTHRRKMLRYGAVTLDEDLADELAEFSQASNGEVEEKLRALDRCLGRLREDERELVEHRYFSKSGLEEFARNCGRPVESLWVTLFRVRAGLRKCIDGEVTVMRVRS